MTVENHRQESPRRATRHRRAGRRAAIGGMLAALVAGMLSLGAPAGFAAPVAPEIDVASTVANPTGDVILAWLPVAGATQYKVEVSASETFSPTLYTATTASLRATPINALPNGTIYWRVAAADGSGQGPYTQSSFERSTVAGPTLIGPGATTPETLHYPTTAPVLKWQPITSAKSYTVSLSTDALFPEGSTTTATTAATSWAVAALLERGPTWYWRVRANLNDGSLTTEWSSNGQFVIDWPDSAPTLDIPANDPGGATPVTDILMRWSGVPGARSYRVYVATDQDFSAEITGSPFSVSSTEYAPPRSWNNSGYYWRVTAVDPSGNEGPPSDTRAFTRAWGPTSAAVMADAVTVAPQALNPTDPTQAYPGSLSLPLDSFRLQWTAVPRATFYEVWMTTGANFTGGTILKCYTAHTSLTAFDLSQGLSASSSLKYQSTAGCLGNSLGAGTYIWRVRAIDTAADYTGSIQGLSNIDSDSRFIRSAWSDRSSPLSPPSITITNTHPDGVAGDPLATVPTPLAPANCTDPATCPGNADTPELRWTPLTNAGGGYWVQVALDADFTNMVAEFHTKSARLRIDGGLVDNNANQAYRWRVMGCSTFTNFTTKSCLEPAAATAWAFRKAGAAVTGLTYTATDPSLNARDHVLLSWQEQLLTAPDGGGNRGYEYVIARDSQFSQTILSGKVDQPFVPTSTALLGDGSYYARVRAIDGVQAALPWSASLQFTKSAPKPTQDSVGDGPTAPPLTWQSVPGTRSYDLELYSGPNLSSGGSRVLLQTGLISTAFTPTSVLAPGTYSWRVRRHDDDDNLLSWSAEPGPDVKTFQITLPAVTLTSPANAASITAAQRLLTWTPGGAGAVKYRVQTANSASFTSMVDNVDTVQTSYALASTNYAAGTTYYWRVQALNASGGVLSSSDGTDLRTFTVLLPPATPAPLGLTPSAGALRATWSSTSANGGSPLTGYLLEYKLSSSGTWTQVSVPAGTYAWDLTGLVPSSLYNVRVSALNAIGQSPAAQANATTAADTTPPVASMIAPPAKVSFVTTVPVSWSGSDIGGTVASYQVQRAVKAPGAGLGTFLNWGPARVTTSATMTGALPGYSYCFRVQAVDSSDNASALSAAKCTTIPTDERSLTAGAGWTKVTAASAWKSTVMTSKTRGASLTIPKARGSALAIVVKKVVGGGTLAVYVGGVRKLAIPTAATKTIWRSAVTVAVPTGGVPVVLKVETPGTAGVTVDGVAQLP